MHVYACLPLLCHTADDNTHLYLSRRSTRLTAHIPSSRPKGRRMGGIFDGERLRVHLQ